MSLGALRKLAKLHTLDSSIREIRARAAALDGGKRIQAKIEAIRKENHEVLEHAAALKREQTDLELQVQTLEDKRAKLEKELYGGRIVNPREVVAMEQEIENLRNRRSKAEDRLIEIMEELPPAQAAAQRILDEIAAWERKLVDYRQKAKEAMATYEAEFKKRTALRPRLAAEVDGPLLARYEAIRKKHGGIGLAEIAPGTDTCGACGMKLATRLLENARAGKVVTCEACHRILYAPEGVI